LLVIEQTYLYSSESYLRIAVISTRLENYFQSLSVNTLRAGRFVNYSWTLNGNLASLDSYYDIYTKNNESVGIWIVTNWNALQKNWL